MSIAFKAPQPADLDYIVECNEAIENDSAGLTKARLEEDCFGSNPAGFWRLIEVDHKTIGIVFYCFGAWASSGKFMWVSQLYVEPEHRGRYFREILHQLKEIAAENNARLFAWATQTQSGRTNQLWRRLGYDNLNDRFEFWAKKVPSS